jgi:putative Mg2+ transporter-C (MgtC) family protein
LSDDWHTWLLLFGRVMLAVGCGAVIGVDREMRGMSAGIRTYALVSIGACLFVMIPALTGSADGTARVIQGVAVGIGFLGAGQIVRITSLKHGRANVKGLTSASATWVAAALGATSGSGLWRLTLVGAIIAMLVLAIHWRIDRTKFRRKRHARAPRDSIT